MRPRLAASSMTSSMRARDRITRLVGRTMPAASASRKSFTALLALSDPDARAARSAGRVVRDAACEALLRAFCCRPRAWPPFRAAARRLVADAPWDLLDEALLERLEEERDERADRKSTRLNS